MSKSGFWFFNLWCTVYFTCVEDEINYGASVDNEAKIAFNRTIRRLMSKYLIDDLEEASNILLYVFLHNPKRVDSLKQYSSIDTVLSCSFDYKRWKENHKYEIKEMGIRDALFASIPSEELDTFMASNLYQALQDAYVKN